jgi:hypothetical protein
VIYERLSDVSPEALGSDELNDLFDESSDEMILSPKKKINIELVIDAIEGLNSSAAERSSSGCSDAYNRRPAQ